MYLGKPGYHTRLRRFLMKKPFLLIIILLTLPLYLALPSEAQALTGFTPEMEKFMASLAEKAGAQDPGFKGFDAERGRKIFFAVRKDKKGRDISCTRCHTKDLTSKGKTTAGKVIEPLAPSVNKKRLTEVKEVKKWLRRNFKRVYGREGTAREKGDVLTFIKSQ